ncbi:MAG: hypothetical protein P8Z79_25095, partial [Sedimentisphaerales bacterium]
SRPQARCVHDDRAGLGAHPAYHTVHKLSKAVDFALDVAREAGLQVAIKTIDVAVCRRLPTVIILIHDMTGIAETWLSRDNNRPCEEERSDRQQQ